MEPTPITRKSFEDDMRDDAIKAFSRHEITHESDLNGLGRWVIRPPVNVGFSWVEIVELQGGYLLAHGDIDAMVFGICSRGESPTPGTAVHWMGRRRGPSDGYLQEKAIRGSGRDAVLTYNAEVARADALEYLEESYEPRRRERLRPRWMRAVERLDIDGRRKPQRVFAKLVNDAWELNWGEVGTDKLANAWGALNRLSSLLRARGE